MIDDSKVAFPSLTNLILALADCIITWDDLRKNNQLSVYESDTLRNNLIDKIAQKYKGNASLSSASFALNRIVG